MKGQLSQLTLAAEENEGLECNRDVTPNIAHDIEQVSVRRLTCLSSDHLTSSRPIAVKRDSLLNVGRPPSLDQSFLQSVLSRCSHPTRYTISREINSK